MNSLIIADAFISGWYGRVLPFVVFVEIFLSGKSDLVQSSKAKTKSV
jgi:hypothetical protein